MTEKKHPFDRDDMSQEGQYAFPYHYIPSFENGHFCQHLYWSWGFRYLGGMELVLSILAEEPFESLADIGCGDGRFLREASIRFPGKTLLGIDYSARAINLAMAMNPDLNYECLDICSERAVNQTFDVVTLVEVLEHIPTELVYDFVSALARYQKPGGRLILTVPHKNKALQLKHYQHFNSKMLKEILEPYFKIDRMMFFDKNSRVFGRISNTLLANRFFILNNLFLLDAIFNIYRKHFLVCSESCCGRICIVGRKK
jgi:SAM-dependent methyltransferase